MSNRDVPDGFKTTEIGPIPNDWKVLNVEDVVTDAKGSIRMGPFGSQLKKVELVSSGFKVYGQENVIADDFSLGDRFIDKAKFESLKGFEVEPGDILITMMGTVGRAAILPEEAEEGIIDSHLLRIRARHELMRPEYFRYLFEAPTMRRQISQQGHGVIMKGLNTSIARNLKVPVPPTQEQETISHVLSTARRAKEETDAVVSALKELKKSQMKHLFTYGPVPFRDADRVALSESETGASPASWRPTTIGQELTLQRGRDLPKKDRKEGKYPVLGANGIVGYHDEYVADPPGILVGRSGSVGEVTFVDEPYWPLNTTLWIKDYKGNHPLFLYYFLQTLDLSKHAAGVSVPTLNRNLIHPVKTRMPELEDQQKIASSLSTIDCRIALELRKRNAISQTFSSLLEKLMTGELRVDNLEVPT